MACSADTKVAGCSMGGEGGGWCGGPRGWRTSTRTGSCALRCASLPSVSIITEMLNLQAPCKMRSIFSSLRRVLIGSSQLRTTRRCANCRRRYANCGRSGRYAKEVHYLGTSPSHGRMQLTGRVHVPRWKMQRVAAGGQAAPVGQRSSSAAGWRHMLLPSQDKTTTPHPGRFARTECTVGLCMVQCGHTDTMGPG